MSTVRAVLASAARHSAAGAASLKESPRFVWKRHAFVCWITLLKINALIQYSFSTVSQRFAVNIHIKSLGEL